MVDNYYQSQNQNWMSQSGYSPQPPHSPQSPQSPYASQGSQFSRFQASSTSPNQGYGIPSNFLDGNQNAPSSPTQFRNEDPFPSTPLQNTHSSNWHFPQTFPSPSPHPFAQPQPFSNLQSSVNVGVTLSDSLQHAANLVNVRLAYDTSYPELTYLVQSGGIAGDYLTLETEPKFIKKREIVLPDALFDQYNQLECKCFMGLFPEITRAWLTIDEKLYLWNYVDGTDFHSFDQLDQIIISVALVTPKPGVFIDDIKYILVVATPIEIILLGIALGNRGDLRILPTQLAVPTDNINILHIVGTPNGRIFGAGKDGNLHEIIYQAEDGWFTRKCRKVNLTYNPVTSLIPTFLLGSEEPLLSLTYDSSRQFLYSLSSKNNIQVFQLGPDGQGFSYSSRITNIVDDIKKFNNQIDSQDFHIVSIHPVTIIESTYIHLVAITSFGERIYFSPTRGKGFEVVAVRKSPPLQNDPENPYGRVYGLSNVHKGFHSNGVLIVANAINEETDSIIGVRPNSAEVARRKILSEISSTINCEGKVWDIVENPQNSAGLYNSLSSVLSSHFLQNELAMQHFLPPKEYLCLTNTGINVILQLRPIDHLKQLISESNGQITTGLKNFFNRYSKDEACSMCLALATIGNSPHTSSINAHQRVNSEPRIAQWATYIFFHMNDEPSNRSRFTFQHDLQITDLGLPISSPEINFSCTHNGLCYYFARIISPIWRQPIVSMKGTPKFITREHLSLVFDYLSSLKEFLDRNPNFTAVPRPWDMNQTLPDRSLVMSRANEESSRQEQHSLFSLQVLVTQCLEGVSFLLLTHDHNFAEVYKSLLPQAQKDLFTLNFENLIITQKGRDICKELVATLLNKYIQETSSVDSVSEVLRQRCPSFLSADEVIFFKANEYLQKAKELKINREGFLNDSLRLFLKVAKYISPPKLTAICQDYQILQFQNGAIELAFTCAQENDPHGQGLQYYRDGLPERDPRVEFFTIRTQCYNCIFPLLKSSEPKSPKSNDLKLDLLRNALTSKDELFHVTLYEWLIQEGYLAILFEIQSPFLEGYLAKKAEDIHNPDRDLLWKYYVRNSMFIEAAKYLSKLADIEDPSVKFPKRIEYLSRAVTSMKSFVAKPGVVIDSELLAELEDKMEVANIQQQIYSYLSQAELNPEIQPDIKQRALDELDRGLYDISHLYNKFAKKFHLNEISLAIFHCSGYSDPFLVESVWVAIIENEKEISYDTLRTKIIEIGRKYHPSEIVFPIGFLIYKLEYLGYSDGIHSNWVYETLIQVGVPVRIIFENYDQIFESKFTDWEDRNAREHLLGVIYNLLCDFLPEILESYHVMQIRNNIEKYIQSLERSPLVANFQNLATTLRNA